MCPNTVIASEELRSQKVQLEKKGIFYGCIKGLEILTSRLLYSGLPRRQLIAEAELARRKGERGRSDSTLIGRLPCK